MSGTVAVKPARIVFSSPKRILVRSFRISRDRWKEKYMEVRQNLKRFRVQVYDACQSRDGWRERAEAAERELEKYKSQAAALEAAVEPAKKK